MTLMAVTLSALMLCGGVLSLRSPPFVRGRACQPQANMPVTRSPLPTWSV